MLFYAYVNIFGIKDSIITRFTMVNMLGVVILDMMVHILDVAKSNTTNVTLIYMLTF